MGVRFCVGEPAEVVAAGLRGGLVVVPSAPVLVRMTEDLAHREALLNADLAITDSGLMVLLWRLFKGEKLERVSGLEYLKLLLERLRRCAVNPKPQSAKSQKSALGGQKGSDCMDTSSPHPAPDSKPLATGDQPLLHPHSLTPFPPSTSSAAGGVCWIMPSEAARDRNLAWLRANGHPTTVQDCYLAPVYPSAGELSDDRLLALIRARKPAHIIICLGGGVQERLGYFLKRKLDKEQGTQADLQLPTSTSPGRLAGPPAYRPGIHCVGAAIGFLTGDQVRIPMWVDYLYLGWLWRCVSAPRLYFPRYWKAVRLVGLMWRHGAEAPVVGS